MNRQHRDRVAFVRDLLGRVREGHDAGQPPRGRAGARRPPLPLLRRRARDGGRAYAGDVIGLPNPGKFAIGDTLYAGAPVTLSAGAALPARALRARAPARHPLEAARHRRRAARGRRAHPGGVPGARPPRADPRRGRPAAARGGRGPAEAGIQRGLQGRADRLRRVALGQLRPEAAQRPREPLHRHPAGSGSRRAPGAAVRVECGASTTSSNRTPRSSSQYLARGQTPFLPGPDGGQTPLPPDSNPVPSPPSNARGTGHARRICRQSGWRQRWSGRR